MTHLLGMILFELRTIWFLCYLDDMISVNLPLRSPGQVLQHLPGNEMGSSHLAGGHSFLILRHWTRATMRRFLGIWNVKIERLGIINGVWKHWRSIYSEDPRRILQLLCIYIDDNAFIAKYLIWFLIALYIEI